MTEIIDASTENNCMRVCMCGSALRLEKLKLQDS